MSDPTPNPKPGPDAGNPSRLRADRQSLPGLPRWVKLSAVIIVVLALVFVGMHLAGGGFRGHAPHIQPWALLP
jgi:hypothetical protein